MGKVKFRHADHRVQFVVFGKRPVPQGGNCDACDAALLVAQAQVVTLTGQLVTANASIQTLTTDLATANAQIVVDTALIASLTAQLAAANATVAALNSQITTLNAQIVALNAVIASLTGPFYVRSYLGPITIIDGGIYVPPTFDDVTITLTNTMIIPAKLIATVTTTVGGYP